MIRAQAIQKFEFEYFATLDPAQQTRLFKCLKTGWENPDSGLGCYAMAPSDYDEFAPFFDAVCQEYLKASADATHVTDWDASAVGDKGVLDVTKLGLSELSMRVRVGRNLTQFNLPGAMDKSERIEFEKAMLKAFDKLKKDPAYGGTVYSLSPVATRRLDFRVTRSPRRRRRAAASPRRHPCDPFRAGLRRRREEP